MHRVVFEVNDKEIFRVLFNVILFFGTSFFLYLSIKGKSRAIVKMILVFLLVENLIYTISMIESYNDIVIAYKNGDYIEIEGMVRNYYHLRGDYEKFTLNGVKFECSGGNYGYCKNGRESLVSGYGRYLRIGYIPGKRRNTIVYIEQLLPEERPSD